MPEPRLRKLKDKGKAYAEQSRSIENGGQNVERWVIAPLQKRTFFDLYETNLAIREQLRLLNNKEMKRIGRSWRQEFEEIDQPTLRLLPERP